LIFTLSGPSLWERQNVPDFGPAPAVNRLVVVANDADVVMRADQRLDEAKLQAVGVLILINLDGVESLLVPGQHLGGGAEEPVGQEQQVVEIDRPGGLHALLVAAVARGGEGFEIAIDGVAGLFGGNAGPFPLADERQQVAGLHRFLGDPDVAEGGSRHRFLVAPVVDREVGGVAQRCDFFPQDAHAKAVEGGHQRAFIAGLAQQLACPFLHLAGRLVGEGDREDA
jgi:hypothetical protein